MNMTIRSAPLIIVMMTPKGGAGKTEVADAIEAALTLSGRTCRLIDVDDGNRGLARRVGKSEIETAPWTSTVAQAPAWVERYARNVDSLIFDLGAGIESADLPVLAFLSTAWRLLQDRGSRIIFCAVVSTNAATSRFIDRIARNYGALGEVVIVCNNQDGSAAFSDELSVRPEPKLHLQQLSAGIQAVRLARQARLSDLIRSPSDNYLVATRMMADRVVSFAKQPVISEAIGQEGLEKLRTFSKGKTATIHFTIRRKEHATDNVIMQNVRVAIAEMLLLNPVLDDEAILSAARFYREEQQAWRTLTQGSG